MSIDSFKAADTLRVGSKSYKYCRIDALERAGIAKLAQLPYSLRILLENLVRHEDGRTTKRDDIEALARWQPGQKDGREIAFRPSRVLLQDLTGVPAIVDLAVMREAMAKMGADPKKINPLQPVELVVDHSVQVDAFGSAAAFARNGELEFQRNRERYAFLKWGQGAFSNFRVVPPDTGIVHQVNIEFLARVVFGAGGAGDTAPAGEQEAYPDTCVGTDSHTTMVNGLGVVAWGVGGIEAEAAMLGQPITMLIPEVIGFKLIGSLREGVTATDLVLTVTEMLRKKGVVGKFVEFYGTGLSSLSVADRTTLGNMSPEYGSTIAIFPIDDRTLEYLRLTGRSPDHVALVDAYAKAQGLFRTDQTPDPTYTDTLALDLGSVVPNVAGPRRPQDRVPLSGVKTSFSGALAEWQKSRGGNGKSGNGSLGDGSVVIAAITSCTNTSNPSVMIGAGLLAKKAVERGIKPKPWVKTSFAPGSQVVTDYIERAGLWPYLNELGFNLVAYGCTTCIGNSGPLPDEVAKKVADDDLIVAAVLSGNRNFEGRIHPQVRANYLASPPLVVAYALAGRMDVDLTTEPLGTGKDGKPVYLRDIWPSNDEIAKTIATTVQDAMFKKRYGDVYTGDERWRTMPVPTGERYAWDPKSEYVKAAPYFEGMPPEPQPRKEIVGARILAILGDSVTTDHISPAGSIAKSSAAAKYLIEHGIEPRDFNSYGARRGNHEVMMRGTFANTRLRNLLVPGVEGPMTRYLPTGEQMSIYDAAMRYKKDGTPLAILAGKEYGSGSSRDWAAKGPLLLGVTVVIAESLERIHRSNLIGMGILPLEFKKGTNRESLSLTGEESLTIRDIEKLQPGATVTVEAAAPGGKKTTFETTVRIDTPDELQYYRHGGILQYVLRQLRDKQRA
jgi:aconitate hydratase